MSVGAPWTGACSHKSSLCFFVQNPQRRELASTLSEYLITVHEQQVKFKFACACGWKGCIQARRRASADLNRGHAECVVPLCGEVAHARGEMQQLGHTRRSGASEIIQYVTSGRTRSKHWIWYGHYEPEDIVSRDTESGAIQLAERTSYPIGISDSYPGKVRRKWQGMKLCPPSREWILQQLCIFNNFVSSFYIKLLKCAG